MSEARYIEVAGKPRSVTVPLEWPIEFEGREYTEITVRRISARELAAWMSAPDGTPPPNIEASKELLDALDAEDGFKMEEVAQRFFPRRTAEKTESSSGQDVKTGEES